MPRFDLSLKSQADLAVSIARAGEATRIAAGVIGRSNWTLSRLEALYELAYLRVFAAWELCQECVFLRSLCGYASSTAGQETLHVGTYYATLSAAEVAALGSSQFMLWHNPNKVISRCNKHIASVVSGCPGLLASIISSNLVRLENLGSIRHRIVHTHQQDAKQNFDVAAIFFAGQSYPGSRPGKFLRDFDTSVPPRRWLDVLVDDFVGLAGQIV